MGLIAGQSTWADDYDVDITANPNIDPTTIVAVQWDGNSAYLPVYVLLFLFLFLCCTVLCSLVCMLTAHQSGSSFSRPGKNKC